MIALDDSGRGAFFHGCHVPAICYADDLCLMSCNVSYLGNLLSIVERFSEEWRLEFTSSEANKTKSHGIVFGDYALASTPSWYFDGQLLRVVNRTEHLGAVMSSNLQAKEHTSQRVKRARGSFYALSPAGMFSRELPPLDKAFMWRMIVSPSLTFGDTSVPLRPEDVSVLDRRVTTSLKLLGTTWIGPQSRAAPPLGSGAIYKNLGGGRLPPLG